MSSGSGSSRIVSLVPSVTETLLAWGIDPVAVTRFCEQPDHEAVGGTKDPDLDRMVELGALAGAVGLDVGRLKAAGLLGDGEGVDPGATPERTAFVPIWRNPWMSLGADTYGADLLRALGVRSVTADHQDRYPTVTLEEVVAARPDLVVAPSEPYPFSERHRAELEEVAPVVLVDGADLLWWGVRTPAAIRRLGAVLSRG